MFEKSLFTATMLTALAALPATAQDWTTSLEAGLFSTARSSTQDGNNIVADPFAGSYIAGYASREFGALKFSVDARFEQIDDQGIDYVFESGPVHSGVLGLHLGKDMGPVFFGGFLGLGVFDGYDSEDPMTGYVGGIELAKEIGPNTTVYGQLGYGRVIGDPGDNEFVGYVLRVGLDTQVSDRLGLGLSYDNGRSNDCFVDCDGPGAYFGLTAEFDYAISDRGSIVGSVSALRIEDYEDPDTGTDTSVFLGMRFALGGSADNRGRLTTPINLFRASGWQHSLD